MYLRLRGVIVLLRACHCARSLLLLLPLRSVRPPLPLHYMCAFCGLLIHSFLCTHGHSYTHASMRRVNATLVVTRARSTRLPQQASRTAARSTHRHSPRTARSPRTDPLTTHRPA